MKTIISKAMVLMIVCISLLSFSPKPGGEGFEIYLNNKMVLQQYGTAMHEIKHLSLDQTDNNAQLIIKYYHCGKVAKNRIVTIRDQQNRSLKEFHFADAATPMAAMAVNVSDIINLKKGKGSQLNIYYASSELSKERLLTSIITGANTRP